MRFAISEPHAQFRQADCCRCLLIERAAVVRAQPEPALPGRPELLPGRPELLPGRPELLPGQPVLPPGQPELPPGQSEPFRPLPPRRPQEPSPSCSCNTSMPRPPE